MPARFRRLGAATAAFALIAALAGCTTIAPTPPHPDEDRAVRVSAPTHGPAALEATVPVPALTGMSLDHARTYAAGLGFRIAASDASAAGRRTTYDEQWIVQDQPVAPGALANRSKPLAVRVLLRGEYPQHTLELSKSGVVAAQRPVMIDLVGMDLAKAADAAEATGLDLADAEDDSGDHRMILIKSNWIVVSQDVAPGTTDEARVHVTALKADEVEERDRPSTTPGSESHAWERMFVGTITGYESADAYYSAHQDLHVLVDGIPIALDLVAPFTAVCDGDTSRAVEERNALLPVGTEVLVERSQEGEDEDRGFVHRLNQIDPADPYAWSANEQLVAGGYWLPDHWTFNGQEVADGEQAKYASEYEDQLTPVQASYAPKILRAGDRVQASPVGGAGICARQLARNKAEMRRIHAQIEKDIRKVEAEYERRKAAGYYSCRDGDGDGRCNE